MKDRHSCLPPRPEDRQECLSSIERTGGSDKIASRMIRQIAVIGTGTMGRGIAYLAALAGYDTVIHDADAAALDAARAAIESTLQKGVERGKVSAADAEAAMARLQLAGELEEAA